MLTLLLEKNFEWHSCALSIAGSLSTYLRFLISFSSILARLDEYVCYFCAPSKKVTIFYTSINMKNIEIGYVYLLDGKIPVTALKPLNRSKTVFSIELPNRSIETVGIERLQPEQADESSPEKIGLNLEPAIHSMPDISNE